MCNFVYCILFCCTLYYCIIQNVLCCEHGSSMGFVGYKCVCGIVECMCKEFRENIIKRFCHVKVMCQLCVKCHVMSMSDKGVHSVDLC